MPKGRRRGWLGYSPTAKIPTPYVLQASLQIFGWDMQTQFLPDGQELCLKRRFDVKRKKRPRVNKPLTSGEVDAKRQMERLARVFANGEDTHTLRLASELADLRAGYANPILAQWASAGFEATVRCQKKKTTARVGFFFWQRN